MTNPDPLPEHTTPTHPESSDPDADATAAGAAGVATEADASAGAGAGAGSGQPRSRHRKGEGLRLREEILDATESLLLKTGSADAVSIRAVCDAAGVTPPSIYRHFRDKEALIAEVCARHFAAFNDAVSAAVKGIDDPVEALVARGRAYIEFGLANPEPYRILFMTRLDTIPVMEQTAWLEGSDAFADVVDNIQACIDTGRLRPDHTDAFKVAAGLWARVHGLTSLAISKPHLGLGEKDFIDSYADECLHGIAKA